MKRKLHISILSLVKQLKKYTKAVSKNYDPEAIHELRKNFKKMRALLRWQKADKKIYDGFREIYHRAGEIRNIQVACDLIEKEKDLPQPFQNWLAISIGKAKKQWIKTGRKKICNELYAETRKPGFCGKKNKMFFSGRIKKYEQLLAVDPVTDASIHELRKMIKDMQYVLEWWKKEMSKTKNLFEKISLQKLEKAAKLIGEYNDKRILLILVTTYAQQEKDASCIAVVNPLIDEWQYIKAEEKEKLLSILRYEKISMPTDVK